MACRAKFFPSSISLTCVNTSPGRPADTICMSKGALFEIDAREKLALHYAGIHRQEDRDARFAVRAAEKEKHVWHMLRVRVPLGQLSARQYLALDDLAESKTYNRSLRVTAGQGIQLHGLNAADLGQVTDVLANAGLAAGCDKAGLEFAIAAPPLPLENQSYRRLRGLAAILCDGFYPQAAPKGAVNRAADSETPAHSPRKFTIGLALPEDNSANIFAHDAGLLLVSGADGRLRVNVYAGGSLSMPTRRPDTYARLASPLGSLRIERAPAAIRAIASVFKSHGELPSRKHTRLKYVVDALGHDRFRDEVEAEMGSEFEPLAPVGALRIPSWAGPNDQHNGEFCYGLGIPWGRIQDAGLARYKSAIRLIVEAFQPRVILCPDQNLIFAGLRIQQIDRIEQILAAYHIPFGDGFSKLRFDAMACAGLPTCPKALAESERVAPEIVSELEVELHRLGKKNVPFTFRISGCPIGCIRPNMADLGLIGRKPGHYDIYAGGSEVEQRFGELYAECVPLANVIRLIRPLLEFWSEQSAPRESFASFYAQWFASEQGPRQQRLIPSETKPSRERIEKEIREFRSTGGNRDETFETAGVKILVA
jgi:sulfite reductase (ferredoxin)